MMRWSDRLVEKKAMNIGCGDASVDVRGSELIIDEIESGVCGERRLDI
jgi:hypothetical protein